MLARTREKVTTSEKEAALKRFAEVQNSLEILRTSINRPWSRPFHLRQALALARAARDTLHAQHNLARLRQQEAKLVFEMLAEAVEESKACLREAEQQIGQVLHTMYHHGIAEVSLLDVRDNYRAPAVAEQNDHVERDVTPDSDDGDGFGEGQETRTV